MGKCFWWCKSANLYNMVKALYSCSQLKYSVIASHHVTHKLSHLSLSYFTECTYSVCRNFLSSKWHLSFACCMHNVQCTYFQWLNFPKKTPTQVIDQTNSFQFLFSVYFHANMASSLSTYNINMTQQYYKNAMQ